MAALGLADNGYRKVYAIRLDGSAKMESSDDLVITEKPSIAVMPFDNLSGDLEQEYFSDSISKRFSREE